MSSSTSKKKSTQRIEAEAELKRLLEKRNSKNSSQATQSGSQNPQGKSNNEKAKSAQSSKKVQPAKQAKSSNAKSNQEYLMPEALKNRKAGAKQNGTQKGGQNLQNELANQNMQGSMQGMPTGQNMQGSMQGMPMGQPNVPPTVYYNYAPNNFAQGQGQPIQESHNAQSAVPNHGGMEENMHKSEPIGKFSSSEELYRAYGALEANFTRRCQENKRLSDYATELENKVAMLENKMANIMHDEEFVEGSVMQNSAITERVINEYLRSLMRENPIQMLGGSVGMSAVTPMQKPRTLAEAGRMVERLLGSNN